MAGTLSDLVLWKPVIGWEDCYEISSIGTLRSIRAVGGRRTVPRECRLQSHGQYYCSMVMKDSRTKRVEKKYIHRMMLEAFVGPCPTGHHCDHIDGNGYNNSIGNLRWLPAEDNYARRTSTGGRACGPTHPCWKTGSRSLTGPSEWNRYETLRQKREETRNGTSISCT